MVRTNDTPWWQKLNIKYLSIFWEETNQVDSEIKNWENVCWSWNNNNCVILKMSNYGFKIIVNIIHIITEKYND